MFFIKQKGYIIQIFFIKQKETCCFLATFGKTVQRKIHLDDCQEQ